VVIVCPAGEDPGGIATVKLAAFETPPSGLSTVTGYVPAAATSAADMEALSCVDDTNDVARLEPFHRTTEPDTNPVPATVSVKAEDPASADEGDREEIPGEERTSPPCQSSNVPGYTTTIPGWPPEAIRRFASVLEPSETPFRYAVRTLPLISSL
jgi:hypothetical protein